MALSSADPEGIVQIKVWLLGISPMVWRRVLVPNTCTLRELHGTLQVAMGWEEIHLYQFCLRAARYGSWELSAASPEVESIRICGVLATGGAISDKLAGDAIPEATRPRTETALSSADAEAIVQVKVWLLGISPMVWRRVLVPATFTLRELHGVIQVAMGWEGIHLYDFCLARRALRLVGAVGVVAGRDAGGAAIPQGRAVHL